MLRGNLSTRPFYNDRLVTLAVAGLAVVVLALTAFNVVQLVSLSARRADTAARLASTRNEAAAVRAEMSALRQGVDQATLTNLAASSEEANALITQRTFSWTALLTVLEQAMPPDVRLVSVSPRVDNTGLNVTMTIVARDVIDVNTFMEALQDTGAFYDLLPSETQAREDGTFTARIEASYLASAASRPAGDAPGGVEP